MKKLLLSLILMASFSSATAQRQTTKMRSLPAEHAKVLRENPRDSLYILESEPKDEVFWTCFKANAYFYGAMICASGICSLLGLAIKGAGR